MNLVLAYTNIGIEGIPPNELLSIINNNNNINVKLCSGGIIMLSNNKIIKCVKEYYTPKDGQVIKVKKMANQCFYIQKALGLATIQSNDCCNCHENCIRQFEEKNILRRKK